MMERKNFVSTRSEVEAAKAQTKPPTPDWRPRGPAPEIDNAVEKAPVSVVEALVAESRIEVTASSPSRAICTASALSRSMRVAVLASIKRFPATIEPMAKMAMASTSSRRLKPDFFIGLIFYDCAKVVDCHRLGDAIPNYCDRAGGRRCPCVFGKIYFRYTSRRR